LGWTRSLRFELRYRSNESPAVAEGDTEFFEVALREISEHIEIDPALSKLSLVST
jgi:hypothetical protein